MADWLAYGLEDAYAEQPDMGIIRKHKTNSGLIKYQPKGDPADWAAAAKAILATEKPDAIVVMLGLNDRISMREPAADKPRRQEGGQERRQGQTGRQIFGRQACGRKTVPPPMQSPTTSRSIPNCRPTMPLTPTSRRSSTPEKSARSPNGVYEFREDRWVELYSKKIEEMIGVLKAKNVPVLWVGLPAVRGTKATADMLFLDSLYRDAAGKAGITYVDVWDGFVDEAGRFLQRGPDFEGQPRKLRADDGVFFTKAGARKLAHYVEREVTRLMAGRSAPFTLPTEPATPDANAEPGKPAPRPLAGPILPLVASSVGTDQLLGGPGSRPAAVDALAARTLVKGEPLAAPAGRADDFAWPRREVGREQAKGETPVASASPDGVTPVTATPPPPKPKKLAADSAGGGALVRGFLRASAHRRRSGRARLRNSRRVRPAASAAPPRRRVSSRGKVTVLMVEGCARTRARNPERFDCCARFGSRLKEPGMTRSPVIPPARRRGAAGAVSASPAQSRCRPRSGARSRDCLFTCSPPPASRRGRYVAARCRRRPWHN